MENNAERKSMQQDHQLIVRARKKASKSICKFQVAAFGFNRRNECILAKTNTPRFSRHGGGIHAEMAIMRLAKQYGIVRILICRVGKGGAFRPINPCPRCRKVAEKLNIKIETVYGNIHREDIIGEKFCQDQS
jgi:cytidine deaminase